MKIAITGHRPSKLGNDYDLKSELIERIKHRVVEECIGFILSSGEDLTFITGMALGIDTLFANIAIEHDIPFIAAIPFKGQQNKWPLKSQLRYNELVFNPLCTRYYVCEPGYEWWKMQRRNEWMVDNCDVLIAVFDGTPGGTANCVKYAESKNKKIIYINPNDYK